MKEYPVQRAAVLKPKPDPDTLVFGKTFTDHMFIMDYTAGQGWHDGRIVPYGPLALEPSAMVLHYAQEVFEGLKAYRSPDGGVQLFRPMENGELSIGMVYFHSAIIFFNYGTNRRQTYSCIFKLPFS